MADSLQQRVLDTIQSGFPVAPNPYDILAGQLDATPDQIKEAISALYADGSVRRIGASFDSRKLGYSSTLCALAVPGGEEELAKAAEVVSAFPGVTHNYGRKHEYNLWFTLITRTPEDKQAVFDAICAQTGCTNLLDMPSTRKYKISVDFGKQRGAHKAAAPKSEQSSPSAAYTFDAHNAFDVELVRWAQGDIARNEQGVLYDCPFEAGAKHVSMALGEEIPVTRITEALQAMKQARIIRRFGAMVRHIQIGYAFNSMTVWDIDDDVVDTAGELFASAPFVSHCYTRPRRAAWPANLYAMVHAQSAGEMQANIDILQKFLNDAGIVCNAQFALETTNEFKKTSMRYFEEGVAC